MVTSYIPHKKSVDKYRPKIGKFFITDIGEKNAKAGRAQLYETSGATGFQRDIGSHPIGMKYSRRWDLRKLVNKNLLT